MLHVSIDEHVGIFFKEKFMVNGKAKKAGKKAVKKTGSSPKRTTSRKKSTGQEKKPSEKKITSKEKQPVVKKVTKKSAAKKPVKGASGKKTKTKSAAQKKSSKKNLNKEVYKEKDTLKIRRTNITDLKKVENVIENLSKKPEPGVRVTVPGVLRIESCVPNAAPSAQKAIPIVEIKNYLKKLFGSNA
jgi:hypothetical protein